jgi:ferredoxin
MAACVDQFLRGAPIVGVAGKYNHTMGRLLEGEMEVFLGGAEPIARVKPANLEVNGFASAEAGTECSRCLHCDCRSKEECLLRAYSDEYGAKQSQFAGEERGHLTRLNQNAGALFEAGKCIKCGLCVRITEREGEPFGFTYVGRGFDVKIGVPLDKSLKDGLGHTAAKVIAACPTGALAQDEKHSSRNG